MQVALTAVRDAIGAVSYVEFVLHPAPMFESFVGVADKILDAIQPAGGAQISEPQQQVGNSGARIDFQLPPLLLLLSASQLQSCAVLQHCCLVWQCAWNGQ